jgi:hypothetical protein
LTILEHSNVFYPAVVETEGRADRIQSGVWGNQIATPAIDDVGSSDGTPKLISLLKTASFGRDDISLSYCLSDLFLMCNYHSV